MARHDSRPRVAVLTEAYLPGWKAGGPVRSLANMVNSLCDRFEFRIITRDRDHGDKAPYVGIVADSWISTQPATVFYGTRDQLVARKLGELVRQTAPDLVVLTGVFSRLTISYLVLKRLHRDALAPTLLIPQGMLDEGALSLKKHKKLAYLMLAKRLAMLRGVHWQATDAAEAARITRFFPEAEPFIASDLPDAPSNRPAPIAKKPGNAVLAFISRISPKKNLPFLVNCMRGLTGGVELRIFGPREASEWDRVLAMARSLPGNIRFVDGGVLLPDQVQSALKDVHFFALPTLGENFGHAIYEALSAGRPVLVSDRTPWRNLAASDAGWDIALEDHTAWRRCLQSCVDMSHTEYQRLSNGAAAYAQRWYDQAPHVEIQAGVFEELIGNMPRLAP